MKKLFLLAAFIFGSFFLPPAVQAGKFYQFPSYNATTGKGFMGIVGQFYVFGDTITKEVFGVISSTGGFTHVFGITTATANFTTLLTAASAHFLGTVTSTNGFVGPGELLTSLPFNSTFYAFAADVSASTGTIASTVTANETRINAVALSTAAHVLKAGDIMTDRLIIQQPLATDFEALRLNNFGPTDNNDVEINWQTGGIQFGVIETDKVGDRFFINADGTSPTNRSLAFGSASGNIIFNEHTLTRIGAITGGVDFASGTFRGTITTSETVKASTFQVGVGIIFPDGTVLKSSPTFSEGFAAFSQGNLLGLTTSLNVTGSGVTSSLVDGTFVLAIATSDVKLTSTQTFTGANTFGSSVTFSSHVFFSENIFTDENAVVLIGTTDAKGKTSGLIVQGPNTSIVVRGNSDTDQLRLDFKTPAGGFSSSLFTNLGSDFIMQNFDDGQTQFISNGQFVLRMEDNNSRWVQPIGMFQRTQAQVNTTTPERTGMLIFNTTTLELMISTGTGVAGFRTFDLDSYFELGPSTPVHNGGLIIQGQLTLTDGVATSGKVKLVVNQKESGNNGIVITGAIGGQPFSDVNLSMQAGQNDKSASIDFSESGFASKWVIGTDGKDKSFYFSSGTINDLANPLQSPVIISTESNLLITQNIFVDQGIESSSNSVNGRAVFISSSDYQQLQGFNVISGSGTLSAGGSQKVTFDNSSTLHFPVVSEISDGGTTGDNTVRFSNVSSTGSFTVHNFHATDSKDYSWWVHVKFD